MGADGNRTEFKLCKDEEYSQMVSFLYCMGSKSESIFNGLGIPCDESKVTQQ